MAKALLLLLVVASVSALQYIGIIVTIDNIETVPLWSIILATGLVAHSITAVLFTAITGIEQKLEILKLRLHIADFNIKKAKISNWPALQLVTRTALIIDESFFDNKMKEFKRLELENYRLKKMTSTNDVKISIDPGSPEWDHTAEVTVEVQENSTRIVKDVKIDSVSQKKGQGKGHMKGKKISEETRRKISEKARAREQAKREQKERIEKTALESKKRKARAK